MAETVVLPSGALPTPGVPGRLEDVPAIRMDGAAVRLGGRTIWKDVDLTIGAGEYVALLGPNGAGKSTLLKAVLGVQPLSAGTVTVLGRRVRRGNDAIGYLPQRRWFDPDLRVRGIDLVRLGLDGSHWGLPLRRRRDWRRRVDDVIDLVGAGAYAHRSIGELSGGEQQRLLIAQALVTGASVLLLDEPLESLDLNNQQAISGLVRRVCREQGVTVLLVAHDVNPVLPHLDQVVYVARTRALSGRPADVIRTDTLTSLYEAPVEVLRTSDGRLLVVGQQETMSFHPQG